MICGMDTAHATHDGERELSSRTSDGYYVRLVWQPTTDRVRVIVIETVTGRRFAIDVDADDAMYAFHHPFTRLGHGGHDRGNLGGAFRPTARMAER